VKAESQLVMIEKISSKDIVDAVKTLGEDEVRYLVDSYYVAQENRKRLSSQIRQASKSGEPHEIFRLLLKQTQIVEENTQKALAAYTERKKITIWSRKVYGIGPVIAAGLAAHIDITRAPTVGHIWRYAGLDPTVIWEKGKRRPWNAELKGLCWKIGESFMKTCNREDSFYGHIYKQRKLYEWNRNLLGELESEADRKMGRFKIKTSTLAYKWYTGRIDPKDAKLWIANEKDWLKVPYQDNSETAKNIKMLPPAHIRERSKRYAVKLFLSHWHHMAYKFEYGKEPPKPYPIAILGHADFIPPQWAE